jgi:hypothetical protein
MNQGFNIFQRSLSIFILISFSLISIPREAIHELFAHHDSHDTCKPVNDAGLSLEEIHTHCDFFKIKSGPIFITNAYNFIASCPIMVEISNEDLFFQTQDFSIAGSDRAPPIC